MSTPIVVWQDSSCISPISDKFRTQLRMQKCLWYLSTDDDWKIPQINLCLRKEKGIWDIFKQKDSSSAAASVPDEIFNLLWVFLFCNTRGPDASSAHPTSESKTVCLSCLSFHQHLKNSNTDKKRSFLPGLPLREVERDVGNDESKGKHGKFLVRQKQMLTVTPTQGAMASCEVFQRNSLSAENR